MTTADDMEALAARLAALAKVDSRSHNDRPGIPYRMLVDLRQHYNNWREFVAELRDPGSDFTQEFPSFALADRERMADLIETAPHSDDDGTA